jgi:hypothetical protein
MNNNNNNGLNSEKELLSASKIWRQIKCNKSFKQWIDENNALYKNKVELGKIDKNVLPFEKWLLAKYSDVLDNSNISGSDLFNKGVDLVFKAKTTVDDLKKNNIETPSMPTASIEPPKETKKTILGLPKIVFYPLAVTVVLGVGYGVYTLLKKND